MYSKCIECMNHFIPKFKTQKYCSDKCMKKYIQRAAAKRLRKEARNMLKE